jgi:hypothetical protein
MASDHGATRETVAPGETGWLVKARRRRRLGRRFDGSLRIRCGQATNHGTSGPGACPPVVFGGRDVRSDPQGLCARFGFGAVILSKEIKKVLVIKLGALGDFVLALAAMKKIREAHPKAKITC